MEGITTEPTILQLCEIIRPGVAVATIKKIGQGGSHSLYSVRFQSDTTWVARVCDYMNAALEKRAITVLKHLTALETSSLIPKVQGSNLEHNDPALSCVVLLDFYEGKPLHIWNSELSSTSRNMFLNDLAEFLLDLWSAPPPHELCKGVEPNYTRWLVGQVDRGIKRCINKSAAWGDAIDYLIMRATIQDFSSDMDQKTGLAISHGDMNADNFITNDRLKLVGVIDWDWVQVAPLPAVVQFPWFVADIPGWNNDGVQVGETFERDRDYLSARTRQYFQAALHTKGVHLQYVKEHCYRTSANLDAALCELEKFVVANPEFEGSPGIEETMRSLQILRKGVMMG